MALGEKTPPEDRAKVAAAVAKHREKLAERKAHAAMLADSLKVWSANPGLDMVITVQKKLRELRFKELLEQSPRDTVSMSTHKSGIPGTVKNPDLAEIVR